MTGSRRRRGPLRRRPVRIALIATAVVVLVSGAIMIPMNVDPASLVESFDRTEHGLGSADASGVDAPGSRGVGPESSPPGDSAGQPEDATSSPCGPFPAFPNETCTGWQHTGASLRDCPSLVVEPGATLDGCRFSNGLEIDAANVTITRSRIEGLVRPRGDLQNLQLVDVEIDGTGKIDPASGDSQLAIGNENYTCLRCHIHDTGRGANLGRNVHIEDSYLHGFPYMDGKHMTAIGSNGGSNFTIRHNNLECDVSGCSAALSFYGDFAPIRDVLVERNLFNTTGSYCTYAGSVDGKEHPVGSNIRYVDNRFGKKFMDDCGRYGPVASWSGGNGNVWQGNTWHDGSGPVQP